MYVCLSRCFFFFVSRWNRAMFWSSVLHVALYETLFFDFWFRPLNSKIYSLKFGTKSPVSRLVWQIDLKCLGLLRGFRRWPIQWNHAKCCGADPCCHGNDICARRGVSSPTGLLYIYMLVYLVCTICRMMLIQLYHKSWTRWTWRPRTLVKYCCWGLAVEVFCRPRRRGRRGRGHFALYRPKTIGKSIYRANIK